MDRKRIYLGYILFLIIITLLPLNGCDPSSSAPSPDQYKEVALRYVKAVADKDFDTFIKLDRNAKVSLKMANDRQSGGPAFDRQERLQREMNDALKIERKDFNGDHYFDKVRGAKFRVLEFKQENPEVMGRPWATVYIEAQGKEKIVLFVELYFKNGEWTVARCGFYR
ncbi:MAG: hypothetical protein Q7V36_00230 [Deltaproteobacteria bacterium]|nr:hypothetical protein [Deltaproteobacteria bacterium]